MCSRARRKKNTRSSILLVINFGLFAANLKGGSIDERKGDVLCSAVSPEHRAYREEHARTTKFIYAHAHSHGIKEKCKSEEN